jgi:hypothetical protein
MRLTLTFSAMLALAAVMADRAGAAEYPARPKDECLHVPGYIELRNAVEDLVKRRDAKALEKLIHPSIALEIGGKEGKEEFLRAWQLQKGAASPIWAQLDPLLRLGCHAESDRQVMMPHMTILDPHWTADRTSEKALILGEQVSLRASPEKNSQPRGLLSWEFVKLGEVGIAPDWTFVTTKGGKSGFVRSSYLRAYLDYGIGFIRQGDSWFMNIMQSGD